MDVQTLIQQTSDRLLQRASIKQNTVSSLQTDGLMFLGNPHDTVPRRLLLDQYLSPRDKYAWQIIRLRAQDSTGAVFPSYDELQLSLANRPIDEKASRSTVSRTLLMLRLTRWLSLCHKARDTKSGRILGNVYALHDEPLTVLDALRFDASYLRLLEQCLRHENKTLRATACGVLHDIKADTRLRYLTSRMPMLDGRVEWQQTVTAGSTIQKSTLTSNRTGASPPSPIGGSSTKMPGPIKGPSPSSPSTKSALSLKSRDCHLVSEQNSYVRTLHKNISNSNTAKTCEKQPPQILSWPDDIPTSPVERQTLLQAMAGLNHAICQEVLNDTAARITRGGIQNPLAYLLATIRKAHGGQFNQFLREETPNRHTPVEDNLTQKDTHQNNLTRKDISKIMNEIKSKCC